MHKRIHLLAFVVFSVFVLGAFNSDKSFVEQLRQQIESFNTSHPEEKVFVHTDRQVYQPADDLWFKAYVVDRNTLRPSVLSRSLHVVVLDQQGLMVQEKQFEIKKGLVEGMIELPYIADEGYYQLVAWSSWMKNHQPELAFRKDFFLKKLNEPELLVPNLYLNLNFNDTIFQPGQQVKVKMNTITTNEVPLNAILFDYTFKHGNRIIKQGEGNALNQGQVFLRCDLPANAEPGIYQLVVKAQHQDQTIEMRRAIQVGFPLIDVQFMPEGGQLVAGLNSKVAFKVTDQQGQPLKLKGKLIDQYGNTLTKVRSGKYGMGSFELTPAADMHYTLELDGYNQHNYVFSLPEIQPEGYAFSVVKHTSDELVFRVQNTYPNEQRHIYLTGLTRGEIYYTLEGNMTGEALFTIPTYHFPKGVSQFTLYDHTYQPVAERLAFVHADRGLKVTVKTDKPVYLPREKVVMDIEVTDEEDKPVSANFSVAVIDSIFSGKEGPAIDIDTYMHLQSELSQLHYVPQGLLKTLSTNKEKLDLLMLTHGWRRFVIPEDLHQPEPKRKEVITGTVYDLHKKGQPSPFAVIHVIPFGLYAPVTITADANGRFTINKDYFTSDLRALILNASDAKGKSKVRVVVDREKDNDYTLAVMRRKTPYQSVINPGAVDFRDDDYAGQRYAELDDFGDYLLLKEILIEEKKLQDRFNKSYQSQFRNLGSFAKKGSDLNPATNFVDYLRQVTTITFVDAINGNVYMRSNARSGAIRDTAEVRDLQARGGVLFVVNDAPWGRDYRVLDFLTRDMIEEITVIKGAGGSFRYGNRASEGIVFVTTREAVAPQEQDIPKNYALAEFFPEVRRFYAPLYENDSLLALALPDLRSTLLWQPQVVTDKAGKATVEFYNADRATVVRAYVNGITDEGQFGFATHRYRVL